MAPGRWSGLVLMVAIAAVFLPAGCGYHLVGKGGKFPTGVDRITIPIFDNRTADIEITRVITDSFITELLGTGKVQVVSQKEAQAVIRGVVVRYHLENITFNTEQQPLETRLTFVVDVSLVLKETGKTIFSEKGITVQHEFPVPPDLADSTREEEEARDYVAKEISQKIISLITEGF